MIVQELIFLLDALLDALKDTAKLTPILFLTYLLMEYLEHHAGDKITRRLEQSKKAGPLIGAAFGLIPQCGFSGAAANLYAAGTITLGSLLAVFAATSDEMLPILLSAKLSIAAIALILTIKLLIGLLLGYAVDFILRKKNLAKQGDIHDFCEQEHCSCNENLFVSALKHTVKIILLIFAVTFLLNLAFLYLPQEQISAVWNIPVAGEIAAALIGLVPNCSSSVLLTNLYVNGVMGLSPLLAGLVANAGVGLLVLFRVNKNKKENLLITLLLLLSGAVLGGLFGWTAQTLFPNLV